MEHMNKDYNELNVPQFNAGWYRLESSLKINKGKVYTFNYFGNSYVCFRNSQGAINIFDAYCPHLGAHLGVGGKIDKDQLICTFHGWKYDSSGTCIEIPYCQKIPKRARLRRHPVKEVHSSVYMHFEPI